MAIEAVDLGCGGIAVAALVVALEATRRNRRLSRRLDQVDQGETSAEPPTLSERR